MRCSEFIKLTKLSLVNLLNAPSSERFRDGSRGNKNEGERDTHAQSDSKRRLKREQKPFFNHLDQVRTVLIHYNQILIRAAGFWLRCIQVAEWVETACTSKLESRLEGTWKALGSRLEVSWKRLQNDHTRRELTDDRKTGGLGRRVPLERSYGNSHKREKPQENGHKNGRRRTSVRTTERAVRRERPEHSEEVQTE